MVTKRTTKKKVDEVSSEVTEVSIETKPKKTVRKKPVRKVAKKTEETIDKVAESEIQNQEVQENKSDEAQVLEVQKHSKQETQSTHSQPKQVSPKQNVKPQSRIEVQKPLPLPNINIHSIIELQQAPMRAIVLNDQQIQMLTMEEIEKRDVFLQETLANVLDYDVVISDTNIWLELLLNKSTTNQAQQANSDNQNRNVNKQQPLSVSNVKLQYERQLEFISKLCTYRGGHFMMMAETYEEIDRFACLQEPQNHKDADFNDNIVYLNAAARLAKRLILQQQRENRLHIEGIGAESHHASFADPAIIRKVTELFAQGKKVLLITNDASVAIRTMGVCDDLQRYNNISDEEWREQYAPLRPMVFTFDDLRLLENYTRQYHFIQIASGKSWMCNIEPVMHRGVVTPLTICDEAFVAGDKRKTDNLFPERIIQGKSAAELLDADELAIHKSNSAKLEQKPKPKRHRPQPKKSE